MFGSLAILALLGLFATPSHASAIGQLCDMAGASDCPSYGTYSPPPQYHEPRERPERCLECEERAQKELEYNLEHMQHPVPAPTLSDDRRTVLAQDVDKANIGMVAIDGALATTLTPVALDAALTLGVSLIALDAAVNIAAVAFPDYVHVPAWLNGLSLTRSVSSISEKTCEKLAASAQSACADLPSETCDSADDCRALLDKRQKRLSCDRAWLDMRKGQCPTKDIDTRPMDRNADEVKRCGRLVANKPECCPDAVRTEKNTACHDEAPSGCQKHLLMTLGAMMSLNAKAQAAHCQDAAQNRADMERCRTAREAEKTQCYEGQLDAGHEDQLSDVTMHVLGCDSFLDTARWLGVCP